MKNFINVTDLYGIKTMVNINNIEYIQHKTGSPTIITTISGYEIQVKETMEEIKERIEAL